MDNKDKNPTEPTGTSNEKDINTIISEYQKYMKDRKIVHWLVMIALITIIINSVKSCQRQEKIANQTLKTLETLEKRLSTMDSDSVATKNNTYKILKLAEKGQR